MKLDRVMKWLLDTCMEVTCEPSAGFWFLQQHVEYP